MTITGAKAFLTVTAAVLLAILGGCDLFVSEQARMDRATQARARGDLRTASIEIKKLLEKNPNNSEAWFFAGEVSLQTGLPAAAEAELRRALELGTSRDRVAAPLGQALISQGHFDRVLEVLDPNGIQDGEAQMDVLRLRGEALLALGKTPDADRTYREMLAHQPDSLDARIGLAQVEQLKGDMAAAEAYLTDVVSRDAAYTPGWLAKGLLDLRLARYRQAEEAFLRALTGATLRAGQEFVARTGLAESQWRQGKSDAALETVKRLLELAPEHPQPKYMRALIAYGAGDYDTAKDYLQQVLKVYPEHRAAAFLLGATHYAQGELEQAGMYLKNALAADPASAPVRKLLAATSLRQKRPQDAITALAPLAAGTSDGNVLALMGEANLQAGDSRTGLQYFERALSASPKNQALQMQLASAYLTTGNFEHAIDLLTKMPETEAGAAGRELLLVLAYLRKGESAQALEHVQRYVAARPDAPATHSLAGSVYMTLGERTKAREHFDRALQLQGDNVAALMNLGRLAMREGKGDEARARFERVVALSPTNLEAMLALAQLSSQQNDQAAAKHWLERASTINPEAVEPKLLLIRYCLETGDRDRARSVARELATAHPANAAAQNALGIVQTADGDIEQAAASFRKAVTIAPDSPNFTYNLARAELALQRHDKARRLLARTLELQPDHRAAVSILAALEVQDGKSDKALARVRALQQSKETAAVGLLLEGDLRMLERKFDDAALAYEAALKRAPNGALAAKSYEARRRAGVPNAAKPLEQWLNDNPNDVGARVVLASEYQRQGQFKQAAAEYEQVLQSRPDDAISLNNLAWVYHELKDPRAIRTAERAHELRPEMGAIADTLGWLLVQEGQIERGLKLLRQAARQAPNVPDIRYHLGVALAKSGEREEARRALSELVDSGQEFKDIATAKQLLREL
jgi:putative PEP-CTERM system TPR-repeat lipoprotein